MDGWREGSDQNATCHKSLALEACASDSVVYASNLVAHASDFMAQAEDLVTKYMLVILWHVPVILILFHTYSLKQVEKFKYLGVVFTSDERQDEELDTWIGKASAVMRALQYSIVMKRELSKKAKDQKNTIASASIRNEIFAKN